MKFRFNLQTLVRVVADSLMVAAALGVAFFLRFIWLTAVEVSGRTFEPPIWGYVDSYFRCLWVLALISIGVFIVSGFYTRGRAYAGQYKAIVVAQAVSINYLLLSFLTFLLPGRIPIPRSVLPIAWILTIVTLVTARLWSSFWKSLMKQEKVLDAELRARNPENVLVIGGAGYIGSALLPKLLERGLHVRLLDMFLYGREPILNVVNHPRLEIVQGDFRQIDRVVEAVQEMDAVIHLGGIVGDPACAIDEQLTIEVNLMATRLIAEVAKGHGVKRFIFASSCSVYGANDSILDENATLNPVSLYARSKIASERILMQLSSGLFNPTVLRFGTIYGLSGRTRFDLVVNLLTAKAMMEKKITLYGGGQWRPFVHVDDAALAVFLALEAPIETVNGEVFNVGSDEQNYTLQQVGELIHKMVPTAQLVDMGRDSDARNYRVSFLKIRRTLNFEPKWSLENGIIQVMQAVSSGRVRDYKDAKYSNVRFLTDDRSSQLIRTAGWERKLIDGAAEINRETLKDSVG